MKKVMYVMLIQTTSYTLEGQNTPCDIPNSPVSFQDLIKLHYENVSFAATDEFLNENGIKVIEFIKFNNM